MEKVRRPAGKIVPIVVVLVIAALGSLAVLTAMGPQVGNVFDKVDRKSRLADPAGPSTSSAGEAPQAAAGALSGESAAGELLALQALPNRQIIYSADVRLQVDEPRATLRAIRTLATDFGGYVSSAELTEQGDDIYAGSVELRVAADRFDEALDVLYGLATEVLSEAIDSQDVTEQYVNLQARIENLERTEAELQAFLSESRERGGNTQDIINIYNKITSVRGEIEQLQGKLNLLADSVALATIRLELLPPQTPIVVVNEGWNPAQQARSALRFLTGTLQATADVLIFLTLGVLPLLLLFALPGWALWRLYRRFVRIAPKLPAE